MGSRDGGESKSICMLGLEALEAEGGREVLVNGAFIILIFGGWLLDVWARDNPFFNLLWPRTLSDSLRPNLMLKP